MLRWRMDKTKKKKSGMKCNKERKKVNYKKGDSDKHKMVTRQLTTRSGVN